MGATKAVFLLFATFRFPPLSHIWSYEFLLLTGTRKDTNMLNGPSNLRNSTEGNAINFTRKIPIFFVAKHYEMEEKFAKIGSEHA